MKTPKKSAFLIALLMLSFYSHAQFISSSSEISKKSVDQSNPEYNRQQDILLLEQKANTMEQDFLSGNAVVFNNHKTEVLKIMDRDGVAVRPPHFYFVE